MFCPNCGTQNPDAAQTCSKCNFHLKSVAAPKFKGTMLMMNQPGTVPVVPPPAGPNTQRTGMPSSTPPPPGAAVPQAPNRLKGTMVGVAPMAGGMPMGGAPRGMNPAVAVPQPGGHPMQQGMPQGMQQPPRTPPPPGMGEMGAGYSPPVPQGGVNPLGGTVAADGSAFNQAFGGPPPQAANPYAAPPPQGTALMPGMGASPYAQYGAPHGAAPGQASGSGAPPPYDPGPPPNPYGAPPPNPFGGPPAGYSPSGPQGMGPMGSAPPQPMVPYGQNAPSGAPGAAIVPAGLMQGVMPGSTTGPTRRNPLMAVLVPFGISFAGSFLGGVLAVILRPLAFLGQLVSLVGTIWFLLQAITMANEVKAVTRNESFAWWPIFIPFYNFYWLWILVPQEVSKAKQLLGVQRPTRSIVLYILIWPYAMAADINDMVR